MHRRARSILRGEQGLSMILVLCIGALFVALAAALVYAASLMMANADRQLPEQDVYELAVSFSDVLEQELLHYTGAKEKDGAMTEENDQSIGYFNNKNPYKQQAIIKITSCPSYRLFFRFSFCCFQFFHCCHSKISFLFMSGYLLNSLFFTHCSYIFLEHISTLFIIVKHSPACTCR